MIRFLALMVSAPLFVNGHKVRLIRLEIRNKQPTFSSEQPNGFIIKQGFHNNSGHTGVDLADGSEGAPIRPIGKGHITIVSKSSDPTGWGNAVLIRHDLPDGTFYSLYAHMMEGSVNVVVGESVDSTVMLGKIDCTGDTKGRTKCPSNNGTGPHLHFGVKTVNALGCGYIVKGSCSPGADSFANYVPDPLAFIAAHQTAGTTGLLTVNASLDSSQPASPAFTITNSAKQSISGIVLGNPVTVPLEPIRQRSMGEPRPVVPLQQLAHVFQLVVLSRAQSLSRR